MSESAWCNGLINKLCEPHFRGHEFQGSLKKPKIEPLFDPEYQPFSILTPAGVCEIWKYVKSAVVIFGHRYFRSVTSAYQ